MNVAITQPSNGDDLASLIRAMLANELRHRPRFEWRPAGTEFVREMSKQNPHELALAVPKAGQ
jgi:hypothetical protein